MSCVINECVLLPFSALHPSSGPSSVPSSFLTECDKWLHTNYINQQPPSRHTQPCAHIHKHTPFKHLHRSNQSLFGRIRTQNTSADMQVRKDLRWSPTDGLFHTETREWSHKLLFGSISQRQGRCQRFDYDSADWIIGVLSASFIFRTSNIPFIQCKTAATSL